jgi:hypothetical protein
MRGCITDRRNEENIRAEKQTCSGHKKEEREETSVKYQGIG